MTISLDPLWRILDGLVHESALADAREARRHRAFVGVHLVAGLLALLGLTAYLAIAGRPSPATAFAFLWLAAPLPIALLLSRTGRFALAQFLSCSAFAAFLAFMAIRSGGLTSPVLLWLAVIPAEAALSTSRRAIGAAAAVALVALLVVASVDMTGEAVSAPLTGPASLVLMAGAILYAGALAFRVQARHAAAERRTEEREHRYRLLADNAGDLITRHDGTGDVAFASPAARLIAGCGPSELCGNGLFQRVHIADRPAYLRALSEADRTGLPVTVQFRLRRGSIGEPAQFVWLEMRCQPVSDPADSVHSLVAVTRDVTAYKDAEAARECALAEAESANLAKGEFLARLSHELRTPLNAIIGFSQILQREQDARLDPRRPREHARLIMLAGEHMLAVVNDILDISRIDAGRLELDQERMALATVVEESLDMLSQQMAEKRLRPIRRIAADLPDIIADVRAFRQILINLLSNAVKFSEPGGRIIVTARPDHGGVLVEVADEGIGISAEDLPRIGTPFVQSRANAARRGEGSGLGLSVVKGLVALHGGSLSIASMRGQGTTVTIRLPSTVIAAYPMQSEERERKIA